MLLILAGDNDGDERDCVPEEGQGRACARLLEQPAIHEASTEERSMRLFADRHEAGRRLARDLAALDLPDPVVLALPRGGVPVAYEVAQMLHAPLDVLLVRKVGAPGNPEFGLGAVAEGGGRGADRDD